MPHARDHAMSPSDDAMLGRLLSCAESVRRDLSTYAAAAGLPLSDLLALRCLAKRGRPMQPSELATALGCSRTNLTWIGKRLVAASYVDEQPLLFSPGRKTFTVTDLGRDVLMRLTEREKRHDVFRALTKRQREQLFVLLALMEQAFDARDETLEAASGCAE